MVFISIKINGDVSWHSFFILNTVGFYGFRSSNTGSYFGQAIADIMEKHALHMEFDDIIREVIYITNIAI